MGFLELKEGNQSGGYIYIYIYIYIYTFSYTVVFLECFIIIWFTPEALACLQLFFNIVLKRNLHM